MQGGKLPLACSLSLGTCVLGTPGLTCEKSGYPGAPCRRGHKGDHVETESAGEAQLFWPQLVESSR